MIMVSQARQVIRYIMIGLTYSPILTLLHSFQHAGMLVFRTLGVVNGLC